MLSWDFPEFSGGGLFMWPWGFRLGTSGDPRGEFVLRLRGGRPGSIAPAWKCSTVGGVDTGVQHDTSTSVCMRWGVSGGRDVDGTRPRLSPHAVEPHTHEKQNHLRTTTGFIHDSLTNSSSISRIHHLKNVFDITPGAHLAWSCAALCSRLVAQQRLEDGLGGLRWKVSGV